MEREKMLKQDTKEGLTIFGVVAAFFIIVISLIVLSVVWSGGISHDRKLEAISQCNQIHSYTIQRNDVSGYIVCLDALGFDVNKTPTPGS